MTLRPLERVLNDLEVRELFDVSRREPLPGVGGTGLSAHPEPIDLLADDRHLRALVPSLRVGFARLSESLRRVLTSVLRSKVEIRDEEPEVLTGRGLVGVADQAACLLVLRLETVGDKVSFGLLALDPVVTFSIIERLFGGDAKESTAPTGRFPTSLERRMLVRALGPVIDAINKNLEPPGYFRVSVHRVEGRLDLVPGFNPDITSLHVPFTMTIGERLASLSIAFPAGALEALRGRLGAPPRDERGAAAMHEAVRDVSVAISVELGRVTLTLRQIMTMRPGEVLTLDRNRNEALPVRLEGVPKFIGMPIQDDGMIAVEITGRS